MYCWYITRNVISLPVRPTLDRGLKKQRDISNKDLQKNQFGKTIINIYIFSFFIVVPCILILLKSSIYQLMHNRVALKEY